MHWSTQEPRLLQQPQQQQQQHLGCEMFATLSTPSLLPQLGLDKLEGTCDSQEAQTINDDKTLMLSGSLWSK